MLLGYYAWKVKANITIIGKNERKMKRPKNEGVAIVFLSNYTSNWVKIYMTSGSYIVCFTVGKTKLVWIRSIVISSK